MYIWDIICFVLSALLVVKKYHKFTSNQAAFTFILLLVIFVATLMNNNRVFESIPTSILFTKDTILTLKEFIIGTIYSLALPPLMGFALVWGVNKIKEFIRNHSV